MPVVGTGSLLEFKDVQERGGNQFLNIYHFHTPAPPNSVDLAVAAAVFMSVLDAWLPPIQSLGLVHTVMSVEDLTGTAAALEVPSVVGPAQLLGAPLPWFVAASIRLARTTKETRGGWKRYVAGTEDELAGNVWTPGFKAALDSLAAVLNDTLDVSGIILTPCIVRKDLVNPASTWLYNPIAFGEAKSVVTTQNTRKFNSGS